MGRRGGSAARAAPVRRGPGFVATVFTLVGVVLLTALGGWQLQRMTWKAHLLVRIDALQTAPPEPLTVVLNRLRDGGEVNFVRVVAPCPAPSARSVSLYGLREGAGPGWRQITACALPPGGAYDSLLVDAGYEPGAAMAAPKPVPPLSPGDTPLTGVLRTPEPPPWFAGFVGLGARGAATSQASGQWFSRDIAGMAAALRARHPAPVMLELEHPSLNPKLTPAGLPTDILPPSQHLGYALTWFGLAAALAAFYAVVALRARAAPKRRR